MRKFFIFTVFKDPRYPKNAHNSNNQTMQINNSPNGQSNNSGIFLASPLSSQRPTSSPIRLSPTQHQDSLVYGDPTLSSPYRRYKKTL